MIASVQESISIAWFAGLVSLTGFLVLVLSAAISDLLSFRIPNKISLLALVLWPVFALATGVDWSGALLTGLSALAVAMILFALKAWGGGDAKLFAVLALWAGPAHILPMVLVTSLAGGFLALLLMKGLLRPLGFMLVGHGITAGADLATARQLPYGLALAAGGVYVAAQLFLGS